MSAMLVKIQILRASHSLVDFGGQFAYKASTPMGGNSNEGEENGQENLEEVKEAPSNQAVDSVGSEVRRI
jgi:hypothetical protein